MRKILLLLLTGWFSFGQAPPPPDGCEMFYALDYDNDGYASFSMDDLRAYVAVDALNDFGWDLSGYDMVVYPNETNYNLQVDAISESVYTNIEDQQNVYIDFIYNGSGPEITGNLPMLRCWILQPVNALADADSDGVSNQDEDLNGNGTLNDENTDDDWYFNFLDPDDDGDGLPTIDEDYNANGNPADDDTNGNELPDYLEAAITLGLANNGISEFSVFPNPSHACATVITSETQVTLSIYDISGKQIRTEMFGGSVEINGLQAGVYLLRFVSQNRTTVKKLIVL